MFKTIRKIVALSVIFCLVFEQSGFAQVAPQLHIPAYLTGLVSPQAFRPIHLRSLSLDAATQNVNLLLDKGDEKSAQEADIKQATRQLLDYFQVGVRLPNSMFWVNLRPDSDKDIIDPNLEKTDVGRILLEADLQLKKDLAQFTSPRTKDGKAYWDKLYAKAESIFGEQDITVPTLTRPWIVPGEILIKQSQGSAYIYKATLKVMLEQDYIKDSPFYSFDDPKLKELNEYSSELIRMLVLPQLTREVNSAKRYAPLRQVYYSLVLAQWFKQQNAGTNNKYSAMIDTKDLTGVTSKQSWSKLDYYKGYQHSFRDGEYDIEETVGSNQGLVIRRYFSGGIRTELGPDTIQKIFSGQAAGIPMIRTDPDLAEVTVQPDTDEIIIVSDGKAHQGWFSAPDASKDGGMLAPDMTKTGMDWKDSGYDGTVTEHAITSTEVLANHVLPVKSREDKGIITVLTWTGVLGFVSVGFTSVLAGVLYAFPPGTGLANFMFTLIIVAGAGFVIPMIGYSLLTKILPDSLEGISINVRNRLTHNADQETTEGGPRGDTKAKDGGMTRNGVHPALITPRVRLAAWRIAYLGSSPEKAVGKDWREIEYHGLSALLTPYFYVPSPFSRMRDTVVISGAAVLLTMGSLVTLLGVPVAAVIAAVIGTAAAVYHDATWRKRDLRAVNALDWLMKNGLLYRGSGTKSPEAGTDASAVKRDGGTGIETLPVSFFSSDEWRMSQIQDTKNERNLQILFTALFWGAGLFLFGTLGWMIAESKPDMGLVAVLSGVWAVIYAWTMMTSPKFDPVPSALVNKIALQLGERYMPRYLTETELGEYLAYKTKLRMKFAGSGVFVRVGYSDHSEPRNLAPTEIQAIKDTIANYFAALQQDVDSGWYKDKGPGVARLMAESLQLRKQSYHSALTAEFIPIKGGDWNDDDLKDDYPGRDGGISKQEMRQERIAGYRNQLRRLYSGDVIKAIDNLIELRYMGDDLNEAIKGIYFSDDARTRGQTLELISGLVLVSRLIEAGYLSDLETNRTLFEAAYQDVLDIAGYANQSGYPEMEEKAVQILFDPRGTEISFDIMNATDWYNFSPRNKDIGIFLRYFREWETAKHKKGRDVDLAPGLRKKLIVRAYAGDLHSPYFSVLDTAVRELVNAGYKGSDLEWAVKDTYVVKLFSQLPDSQMDALKYLIWVGYRGSAWVEILQQTSDCSREGKLDIISQLSNAGYFSEADKELVETAYEALQDIEKYADGYGLVEMKKKAAKLAKLLQTKQATDQDGGNSEIRPGGIDLRALPVTGVQAGAPVLTDSINPALLSVQLQDLDKQWAGIQKKMCAGPMPYAALKEYAAVCRARQDAGNQLQVVNACILRILKMEELAAVGTSPELTEIIAAL